MRVKEALTYLQANLVLEEGRFFGPVGTASLGVGLIAQGVLTPIYDCDATRYRTFEAAVYLLSHECDLAQENVRPFNDHALVCPIISFEEAIAGLDTIMSEHQLRGFLAQLGQHNVSRVIFLPCYEVFEFGGLLYLNKITSTHISVFKLASASLSCAVTAYGLQYIDRAIENHFLRPKDDLLPGTNAEARERE